MSMSAGLIWPEAVEDPEGDEHYANDEQPGFHDPYAWAWWLARIQQDPVEDLGELGCGALLALYVGEMSLEDVRWTCPGELAASAEKLSKLVGAVDESVKGLVGAYAYCSNSAERARELLLAELEAIKTMAAWAESLGKKRLAFEIG